MEDKKTNVGGTGEEPIDPVCLAHGKKMSEHQCLFCCMCFKDLTPEECNVLPSGDKEDVCKECAEDEKRFMNENQYKTQPELPLELELSQKLPPPFWNYKVLFWSLLAGVATYAFLVSIIPNNELARNTFTLQLETSIGVLDFHPRPMTSDIMLRWTNGQFQIRDINIKKN